MRRVAVVHEWLDAYAGSERVIEHILALYPDADLYAVVDFLGESERGFLKGRSVKTTFIQSLPFASKHFRSYLPLMPLAIEQLDLSGYDLIISSNHAVAKGVISGPDQLHVSYVHSPMRYAWDLQHQYLRELGLKRGLKSAVVRAALHNLRSWDVRSANGVDLFVANSRYIARRIMKVYRRRATVIYPPVAVSQFQLREDKEPYYLAAGRLVPYKRVDLIVEAFTRESTRKLVVIGDGSEYERIRSNAGSNVTFLGSVPHDVLRDNLQRARALVYAAEEDFGILPVEAMACGTPVIAFGRGGVPESVIGLSGEEPTGVFFASQTVESILAAIDTFEREYARFVPAAIRARALGFSEERFRESFFHYVEKSWEGFSNRTARRVS